MIGYLASQIIQGATHRGYDVCTNLKPPWNVDGRHFRAKFEASNIQHRPQPSQEDFLVIDEFRSVDPMTDSLYNNLQEISKTKRVIVLHYSDTINIVRFPDDNLQCFFTHQTHRLRLNPSSRPLGFGCTFEAFAAERSQPQLPRAPGSIILNFTPSVNQGVRISTILGLESFARRNSVIHFDKRRLFGEAYSQQLATSQFILAVGGDFFQPLGANDWIRETQSESPILRNFIDFPDDQGTIFRWDSFRFWESMALGCIPIQLDFDFYGLLLPIQPEPWLHYVPLKLHAQDETFERIAEIAQDKELMKRMSLAAKDFCFEFYSPECTFNYVIEG